MSTPAFSLDPTVPQMQPVPQAPPATEPNFDALFGIAPPATPPAVAAPQAPPTAPEVWYQDPVTGTVYRTESDARTGIAQKDQYIAQLRQQISNAQQVFTGQQPQAAAPESFVDVLDKVFKPGGDAKSADAYLNNLIATKAEALIKERLGPMSPLIERAGLDRAVELASQGPKGDPNIPAFVRSESFRNLVRDYPVLRASLEQAKVDPQYAMNQLPEVLQLTYLVAQAKAGAPAAQVSNVPTHLPVPSSTTPPTQSAPALSPTNDPFAAFAGMSNEDWRTANNTPKTQR